MSSVLVSKLRNTVGTRHCHWHVLIWIVARKFDITCFTLVVASVAIIGLVAVEEEAKDGGQQEKNPMWMR